MRLNNNTVLFSWPLDRHCITQGYIPPVHYGLDLRCTWDGTTAHEIRAAEPGIVVWVQKWDGKSKVGNQSYGNAVKIRHGMYKGHVLETLYAHLSDIAVKLGDEVEESEIIGLSGNTGNSKGAHLHFEVRYNGTRVQPLYWLDDDFTKASPSIQMGAFTSVKRPAEELKTVQIGPISAGDVALLEQFLKTLNINQLMKEVQHDSK